MRQIVFRIKKVEKLWQSVVISPVVGIDLVETPFFIFRMFNSLNVGSVCDRLYSLGIIIRNALFFCNLEI